MERKTQIHAEDGRCDLLITREFDLPLDLLFKAYEEAEIIEQWMGTKVVKLENRQHGGWEFQTSDPSGNLVFHAHGVIHAFEPNRRIIRTFEMVNAAFEVQLEFLDFKELTPDTSMLKMQIVYRSAALRDAMLKLPFAYGVNMAHNRLEEVLKSKK